jgi:two-component system, LytTR family, response regulator
MKNIHAVIIDDEPDSISLLQLQLEKNCSHVRIIKIFSSSLQALKELPVIKPELVFLDIEMPDLNGFELLEKLSPVNFKVIFITAYNQYAIKAFRFNALDYLVKPISTEDLVIAVDKSISIPAPGMDQLNSFAKQMKGEPVSKIAVSAQSGIIFIELNDIIYAEASGNYSKLIMKEGNSYIISKTLKDIQDVLEERNFFRIHRQYIINLNKVKHFNRVDSLVLMDNKAELPVARVQKEKLEGKFDWL